MAIQKVTTGSGLFTTLALVIFVGCGSVEEKERVGHAELPVKTVAERPTPEAQHLAVEQNADYVSEVKFAKGSADLSTDAQNELKKLFDRVRKEAPIDEVKVISWADRDYPSEKKAELSAADKSLASRRIESIENYIKNYGEKFGQKSIEIEAFNMAERPSKLQRLFGSSEAKVKKALEKSGLTADAKTSAASRAGTAMVMVHLNEEKTE